MCLPRVFRVTFAGMHEQNRRTPTVVASAPDVGRWWRCWLVEWVTTVCGCILAIVKRPEGQAGFPVVPRRRVGARTVAWLRTYRHLRKDDEARPDIGEALIYAALVHLMVRRLARIHAHAP